MSGRNQDKGRFGPERRRRSVLTPFALVTAAGLVKVLDFARSWVPLGGQFWGDRGGAISDPEGYNWWIATRKEDLTDDEIRRRADEFFKQMAAAGAGRP